MSIWSGLGSTKSGLCEVDIAVGVCHTYTPMFVMKMSSDILCDVQ